MPRVEFELMIAVLERAKTFHTINGAATVIGLTKGNITDRSSSCKGKADRILSTLSACPTHLFHRLSQAFGES
jgi:hypothetical protein